MNQGVVIILLAAWLFLQMGLAWRQNRMLTGYPTERKRLRRMVLARLGEAAWLAGLLLCGGLHRLEAAPGIVVLAVAIGGRDALRWGLGRQLASSLVTVGVLAMAAGWLPDHGGRAFLLWAVVELAGRWVAPMLPDHRSLPLVGRVGVGDAGGSPPRQTSLYEGQPAAGSPTPNPSPQGGGASDGLPQRLATLLTACGLPHCPVRLAPAMPRANARFTGLPGARRIVLSPGLLTALTPDAVAAVVAHEAGHCRLRHEEQWLLGRLALGLALVIALPLPTSPAALAALWLLLPIGGFFLRPLPAALRRHWEYQADAFAARHAGAAAMAEALRQLDQANGAAPAADPWYAAFHAYHPGTARRLDRLTH